MPRPGHSLYLRRILRITLRMHWRRSRPWWPWSTLRMLSHVRASLIGPMDMHVAMLNRHSLRDVWGHWRRRRRRIWGRLRRIIRSHFCHFHFSEI